MGGLPRPHPPGPPPSQRRGPTLYPSPRPFPRGRSPTGTFPQVLGMGTSPRSPRWGPLPQVPAWRPTPWVPPAPHAEAPVTGDESEPPARYPSWLPGAFAAAVRPRAARAFDAGALPRRAVGPRGPAGTPKAGRLTAVVAAAFVVSVAAMAFGASGALFS